jgi:hypothetical protein
MTSRLVVINGAIQEVEDGERIRPKETDIIELEKCSCNGDGCEDIKVEFPGAGFIVRNVGAHRVRVGMQLLSGLDCGRWTHFDLHPGEAKVYYEGGYCCPYEATHY